MGYLKGKSTLMIYDRHVQTIIINISDVSVLAEKVSEIANLATFMVSNLGNMIVGDTVYISGGSGVISMHH